MRQRNVWGWWTPRPSTMFDLLDGAVAADDGVSGFRWGSRTVRDVAGARWARLVWWRHRGRLVGFGVGVKRRPNQ